MPVRVSVLTLLGVAAATMALKAPPPPPGPPPCAGNSLSSSAFGCANADNLRAMVANPGDLVRGREMGGSDAIIEAAAVTRYRTDRVKKLRTNSTTTRQTATSE